MSINVRKLSAPQNDTEPPEELEQLSKETDRMRERAVGPGRSVTYEEWAEFAQGVKVGQVLRPNRWELNGMDGHLIENGSFRWLRRCSPLTTSL